MYGIYLTFLCYYVASLCTLTFDLLTLTVLRVQYLACPTQKPILVILRLSATELRVTEFAHISVGGFRWLSMRRVTWPITVGAKWATFLNSLAQFSYSLCHFHALRGRLSYVIGENSFSIRLLTGYSYIADSVHAHYEGYKVHYACAVSRDLCIGGSQKTTRNNFLTPNCLLTIQLTSYGAMTTIKGSLYRSTPMFSIFRP